MSKTTEKKAMTIDELRRELADAKRSHKMGELKNTARMRELRVEIARALTAEKSVKEENK